jgi:hypothetical protein
MGWFILFALLVLFILGGIIGVRKQRKNDEILKSKGYSIETKAVMGKYIAGHPDLDNSLPGIIIFLKDGNLEIHQYSSGELSMPVLKAKIPVVNINNIVIEDQSSIERRITAARLLTVGVFALAWKKKKKDELAFITIEWKDGKFNHETIFEFEGKEAMQKANIARNQLIKISR